MMEQKYEVGKWYGWDGGECPVHPEAWVSVTFPMGECYEHDKAKLFDWDGPLLFCITRLPEEKREPREFWIDPERCIVTSFFHVGFIHVREVIK